MYIPSEGAILALKLAGIKKIKRDIPFIKEYPTPHERFVTGLKVEYCNIDGRKVTRLKKHTECNSAILYLHGGSYKDNFLKEHWRFLKKVAVMNRVEIFAPDYPLIPNNYKDAYKMVTKVYKKILEKYDNICVMGDSAGGGFAIGLSMYLRDKGYTVPNKCVMISPWLDIALRNEDISQYEKNDPLINLEKVKKCGIEFSKGEINNPYVSPMYGSVKGLGELYLFVGTYDILCADAYKFKAICYDNDVNLHLTVKDKMLHVYPLLPIKESEEALEKIKEILIENKQGDLQK